MNSKKYFALAKENGIDVCELTLSKDTSLNFEIFKGEVISLIKIGRFFSIKSGVKSSQFCQGLSFAQKS